VYAEVVLASTPHAARSFTYAIPHALAVAPGDAVIVPFGAKMLPGIVFEVSEQPRFDGELRAIADRLGDAPLLLPHQLALARWMADYYVVPPAAAVALMLPRGTRVAADLLPKSTPALPALAICQDAAAAVRALATVTPAAAGRALRVIAALLDRGEAIGVQELRRQFGLTASTQRLLVTLGLVEHAELPQAVASAPVAPVAAPVLTDEQQCAVAAIEAAMRRRFSGARAPGTFVLHGVTGSGKTEVYLAALDAARRGGRQGIVLVPEIALTPQTVERFSSRFPGRAIALHGRVGTARHRAAWFGARAGAYEVVIGARSALFAPLPNLGLIIVDEEHEPSYKQSDVAPRYHARDAAVELARLTGAVAVLGSATPDVATYRHTETGRYHLLRLASRVAQRADGSLGTIPLPDLQVVNMTQEPRDSGHGVISRKLTAEIERALAEGDQTMLFLNRRGSASLLLCRDCGFTPRCPRCMVAYALHTVEGRLICHQCRRGRGVPPRCPKCGGEQLRPLGIGTQRLEEIVREQFPRARVLRWDSDSAGSQSRHAAIARTIRERETDIIVGTQVIAKGHDFDDISLVGAISADLSLNVPDFRAAERTFQLLTQVAGRAGRRDRPGRVIVQTYNPDHYAVRAAGAHDYPGFYLREMAFRRRLRYPPLWPLARLLYRHRKEASAEHGAEALAATLRTSRERLGLPGPELVGPAPCYFSRLAGWWRWQILLHGGATRELLNAVALPPGWSVDIDPMDLL
jgi:primosomal protein N' (replication factor Y)